MSKTYISNLETSRIELHFEKSEYKALTDEQRRELKRHFLWSNKSVAWVSRSTQNHYWAIETAKKLGFTEGEKVGERLSYAEQLQVKVEKAEHRAERFDQYAENAVHRAENLQAEFNECRKDWSWLTQPIIRGHAGSETFARRRQRIVDRYDKGFEEYRKSDYFKDRAATARATTDMSKLKSKPYLQNRIDECNSYIKHLQGRIVEAEQGIYDGKGQDYENWLDSLLGKMEFEMDKLAFFENCMDDLGGVQYSKENIKPGYLVKIRGSWDLVLKSNPKTAEVKSYGLELKYSYAEIQEVKIPEGWTEQKEISENPFTVGDIVTRQNIGGNRIIAAFQIIKATEKTVSIRRIQVVENRPVLGNFISDKLERKTVKKDRSGNFVLNDDSWYLYKYQEVSSEKSA